ncbi:MAG TPA: class I SAM-dependent methyltransferase, partial [Planctomycetaceae bacterium]
MTALLLPGRHHLLTNFQLAYLTRVLEGDPATLADVDGRPLDGLGRVDAVVWAVTSANHANTRRNPLPAHRREAAIEAFAAGLDAASFVYLIDDVGVMPRFAEYVLKKVAVDSRGRFRLTPANCVVGCSTPGVIELYERLGFRVLPFELADRARETYRAERPWELVEALAAAAAAGRDWRTDERFVTLVSRASRRLYLRYGYGDLVADLHRSPLLTDDGDLTATRDYNAYVRAFDEGAARKAALVRDHVRPGRIVDVGCCTGAVLRELTQEGRLRESDFYGIEVARPLYAECLHRKEQGAFANENVFFYHCDFAAGPVFPPDSVDTLTTFSLTHEIESYSGREALLRFVAAARDQLAPGGRWINVDVVGPEGGDEPVVLRLARGDGSEDDPLREFGPGRRDALRAHLEGLSTYARFLRFARDFRRAEGYALRFERFEAGPAGGADAAADDNDAAEGGGAS